MGIIIKYILKNISEKKLRTFLIVFSITISSALFFSSSALSGSLVQMFNERMKQFYGTSDFMIHAGGKSTARNFNIETAKPYFDRLEYIIGGFNGSADYKILDGKTYNFSLKGTDFEKHKIISPVNIIEDLDLYPFEGKKMIISSALSERLGLNLGDTIDLIVAGSRHKFTISAVAAPNGFLFDDGESHCALVPQETLASLYNMRGKDNVLYVKLKNSEEKRLLLDKFRTLYKGCGFSVFSISTGVDVPLKLLTAIVSFMSIFIIYSSFKVITLERLPVIGTFRSIGATRRTTSLVLVAESFLYGVIGGILGCGLGVGILYIMTGMMKNNWTRSVSTSIIFTPVQMLTAFLLAILLCVVSSIIPILRAASVPIKDIILNMIEKHYKRKTWKPLLGILLTAFALIVPQYIPLEFALGVDLACLILLGVSAVLLTPALTSLIVLLLQNLYTIIFGNIGVLAAKNLKENKSILNSISLLSIGISTLLMVTTASDSMTIEVLNAYTTTINYDINMRISRADIRTEQKVRSVDGVSSTYGNYSTRGIPVQGFNEHINQIDGIGSTKYFDFWNITVDEAPESLIKEFDSGRNIMISNSFNYYLNMQKGDTITLKMPKGERIYTILGFYDTTLNNGNHAMISEKFMKLDTGNQYFSSISIKTSKNPDVVAGEIRKTFKRENPMVETIKEIEKRNLQGNKQLMDILLGFSILSLLIGITGVFNNLIISFIERKHSLAVLKSIGMSKPQTIKMIFIEALTGGLVGGITGVIVGSLQLFIIPAILRATGQLFPIHYNHNTILLFITTAIIITLVASISPALKSSRLDIVASIKYE